MNVVISVAGKAHSGKDTFTSMLIYINKVGISKAKYTDWAENYSIECKSKSTIKNIRVFHFADKLKDICSVLTNIPRDYFDNTDYKDNYYYSFRNREFKSVDEVNETEDRLTISDFKSIEDIKLKLIDNKYVPLIKIRTIMQVFADMFKELFGEDYFVNLTIKDLENAVTNYGLCFIADLRFKNEKMALNRSSKFTSYSILIDRPNNTNNVTEHNSEKINFNTNFIINNDSTLMVLFYKALDVYTKILEFENKIKYENC